MASGSGGLSTKEATSRAVRAAAQHVVETAQLVLELGFAMRGGSVSPNGSAERAHSAT